MAKKAAEKAKDLTRPGGPRFFLAEEMPDEDQLEYVEMPSWWTEGTKTKGLPFGKIVQIAGDSDSGKTSCCISAIKAAQEQNVTTLYIETEGKTQKQDFINWGVDPKKLYILQDSIAENIYDAACDFIDLHKSQKMLIVLDSIGNVLSTHDADRSLAESAGKPGGKGKTNREGLNKLIAKRTQAKVAILLINYTYANIGSPGKTNAGGKALNFFSSLTYQTSRKSWLEKTINGQKVRIGAKVQWTLFKNHIDRQNPGPKVIEMDITAEGIKLVGASDGDE